MTRPLDLKLTPEEQAAVRSLEDRLSHRARFPVTLDTLFHLWSDFVTEVEVGYASTAEEYINDVTSRDLIEEVVKVLPESGQRKLTARIRPLDERFMQATQPDVKQALPRIFKPGPGWWWSRIPLKLSSDLSSTLNP